MTNPEQTCGICSSELSEGSLKLTCNGPCRKAFHALCASMDMALLNACGENGILWFCRKCRLDLIGGDQQQESGLQATMQRMYGEIQERYCESSMAASPQFPVETWIKVFENLSFKDLCQVRSVSSGWRMIVESFFMSKFILKIPLKLVSRKLKTFPKLPTSTLIFKDNGIFAFGWCQPFIKQLVNLEFNSCKKTSINLLKMLRHTRKLDLLRCCESTLIYVKTAFERLSDLDLEEMEKLILGCAKQDEILQIFQRRLTDYALLSDYRSFQSGMLDMIKMNPKMEGLSLISSSNYLSHLAQVPQVIHMFKRVSLTIETNEDGYLTEHLISFARNQPFLECFELRIQRTANINTRRLSTILQHLLRLKRLSIEIRNVTNTIDLQFIGYLTELEYFGFHGADVSYNGAINLKLEELFLSGATDSFDLRKYLAAASNLRTITLQCYILKSWSDLFIVSKSRGLRCLKLKLVHVQYNYVWTINECFDELRCLELELCSMEEELLLKLFGSCPRLEELHLESIQNVSDAVILVLCQKMKHLRKLTIRYCAITDATARHITEHALALEQLSIWNCENLTTAGIAQLKSANIKIVGVWT